MLRLPMPSKPYEMVKDICEAAPAVVGVLLQEGRPVAYPSRKFTAPEAEYSATGIEMMAVISALREWH